MDKLLPCPHCGCEDVRTPTRSWHGEPIPRCRECLAEAPSAEAWNRRDAPPAPADGVDVGMARDALALLVDLDEDGKITDRKDRSLVERFGVAIAAAERVRNPGGPSLEDAEPLDRFGWIIPPDSGGTTCG